MAIHFNTTTCDIELDAIYRDFARQRDAVEDEIRLMEEAGSDYRFDAEGFDGWTVNRLSRLVQQAGL